MNTTSTETFPGFEHLVQPFKFKGEPYEYKVVPLAAQVVLLIDGGVGLGNMGSLCFANATQIVDFYHALEHAGKVLLTLLGSKEHPDYKPKLGYWAKQLLKNKVAKLIAQTRAQCAGKGCNEAVERDCRIS